MKFVILLSLCFVILCSSQKMTKSTTGVLKRLRALLKNTTYVSEPLNAYIVLSEDAHQSEYSAARDHRREFLSGFSGSSGTVIVTENQALLWTDGRYFSQATKQLDENWILMKEGIADTPTKGEWLSKTLPSGAKIGFDPMTMAYRQWKSLQVELEKHNQTLIPVSSNLVDLIWDDRPDVSNNIVFPLELKYTGETSQSKIEKVRAKMKEKCVALYLITALDEVAWLLNLRGSDIPFNPVFFAYVLISPEEVHLFMNESKVTSAVRKHLDEIQNFSIQPYDQVLTYFARALKLNTDPDSKIWISHFSSYAFVSLVPEKQLITDLSSIAVLKAIKNDVEIEGMIKAHVKDAAALCCYFAWLEKELAKGNPNLTEIYGDKELQKCRQKQEDFMGLSFDTISSSGPHGAIIHYKPTPETDRAITTKEMYLCDSGGQYKDGTTDVTRTLHFGVPSDYEKECFTRVLKGHIQLRLAKFPHKIKGNVLDSLARKYLWDVGLNYHHGTGHGIGAFLNVHEGPMSISWRENPDDPGLQEGMFLSNEPGYYEDEKFGVRIENIVRIVPATTKYLMKDVQFLTFEDVTVVPIQKKLLVPSLLTVEEIAYLNDYHMICREKVGPLLKTQGENDGLAWLMKETEPIG